MKKRKISVLVMIVVAMAAMVLVGCVDAVSYKIEGNADIRIGVSATEYDFLDGVKGYKGDTKTEVAVDYSQVKFGTKGEYEITYTVGTLKQTQKVYIYGTPEISFPGEEISYADASTEAGLLAGVTAKDTFGGELKVTVSGSIQRDDFGRIAENQQIKYTARDEYGNAAEKTRSFTVTNSFKINDKTADFADADVTLNVGGKFKGLYKGEEKIASENYFYQNGILGLEVDYLVGLGKGEFEFLVVTDDGWSNFKLTLTDNEAARFNIPEFVRAYAFAENYKIYIPEAQKVGYQNLTFAYSVSGANGEQVTIGEENDKKYFVPTSAGKYTLTVKAMRDGSEAGEMTADIFVRGDVVVLNETDDCENAIECAATGTFGASEIAFSEDKKYGDETGSARITGTLDKSAYLSFSLKNTKIASTDGYYGIEFNLFNDTGEELELYTYWAQIISIPADAAWNKIRLTMNLEHVDLQGLSIAVRIKGEQGNLLGKSIYLSDITAIKSFGTISSEDITGIYRGTRASAGDVFEIVLKENNEVTFGSRGSATPYTGSYVYCTDGTLYFCVATTEGKYYSGLGTVKSADGKKYLEMKDSWLGEIIRYDLYENSSLDDVSSYTGVYCVNNFYFILRNDKTFDWGYSEHHNKGTFAIYESGEIEFSLTEGDWYKKAFAGTFGVTDGVKNIAVDLGAGNQTYSFVSSSAAVSGNLAEHSGRYEWTENAGQANECVWVIEIYSDGSMKWGYGGNLYDTTYVLYEQCFYITTTWNNGQSGVHWFGVNSDGVATISGNVGVRDLIVYVRTGDIVENPELGDVSAYVGVYTLKAFYYILNADKTFTWGYASSVNTGTYSVLKDGSIKLAITSGDWYKKDIAGTIGEINGTMTISADIGVNGVEKYARIASDMQAVSDLTGYEGVYTWINPSNANDNWFMNIYSDGSATWGYSANGFVANVTVYRGGALCVRNKYDSGDGWRVIWYKIGENENGVKTLTTTDNDRGEMIYSRITSLDASNEVSDVSAYYGTYSGSGFVFEWTATEMKWGWGDNRYNCEYKLYADGTLIIRTEYNNSVFICKLKEVEGGYSITGNTGMNGFIEHIAAIG